MYSCGVTRKKHFRVHIVDGNFWPYKCQTISDLFIASSEAPQVKNMNAIRASFCADDWRRTGCLMLLLTHTDAFLIDARSPEMYILHNINCVCSTRNYMRRNCTSASTSTIAYEPAVVSFSSKSCIEYVLNRQKNGWGGGGRWILVIYLY